MTISRFWIQALFSVILCLSAFGTAGYGASGDPGITVLDSARPHGERMDRAWKRYRNADLGYCVNYPSRWMKGQAFEGSGLFVEAGLNRSSKPTGEIDVGPLNAPGPEDARLKPVSLEIQTLDQDLEDHLAGLKKFVRAERVEVLAQHRLNLQGANALFAKNQYYDPLERSKWMEEVVFIEHKGQRYRLELQCPPDQIDRFEPVFSYLVSSFQFDCK